MSESIYGIGETGYVRMRMPEILSAMASAFKVRTGLDLDLTPRSVTGVLIGIAAEREAFLWELAEKVYLSSFPVTAVGSSLDLAVSYAGVRRIQASPSDARAVFVGDQGTVVPSGSVVESTQLVEGSPLPPRFTLRDDVTIARENAAQITLRLPVAVLNGVEYWIDWQTFRATVTATGVSTPEGVATSLKDQLVGFGAGASVLGASVSISSGSSFTSNWSTNIISDLLGSPGTLYAEDTGPIPAPSNSLTTIITPVTGWRFVTNINAARVGTDYEGDAELRHRYVTGVYRLGAGTVPSIKANLQQDIVGATSVEVYENTTLVTDGEGLPAKSIEVVIEGGDDLTIATRVYQLKPAGISTHGNTSVELIDSGGFVSTIYISRPEQRQIWLRATITTTPEETIPGNILEVVRQAMLDYGATLDVGENVYLQRVLASVFRATSGVASVDLTATVTAVGDPTPLIGSYTSADIAIGTRQRAVFRTFAINVA